MRRPHHFARTNVFWKRRLASRRVASWYGHHRQVPGAKQRSSRALCLCTHGSHLRGKTVDRRCLHGHHHVFVNSLLSFHSVDYRSRRQPRRMSQRLEVRLTHWPETFVEYCLRPVTPSIWSTCAGVDSVSTTASGHAPARLHL